jgi:hypothetical protein
MLGQIVQKKHPMAPRWVDAVPYHFDNLGASALTLFELSTTENANYLMYAGVDSVSVDHAPIVNYRPWAALYYVAFTAIGSLFLINIFVGESSEHRNRNRNRNTDRFLRYRCSFCAAFGSA